MGEPMSQIPRRAQLEHQTPAEAAIRAAVAAVEDLPPDVRLTDAVTLLLAGLDSVADYVDGQADWRRLPQMTPWTDPNEEG